MFQWLKKVFAFVGWPPEQAPIRKAYREGYRSPLHINGNRIEHCAYASGTPEHAAWRRGFGDAMRDYQYHEAW